MKRYRLKARMSLQEDGGYLVEVPELQGCWTVLKRRQPLSLALEDIREIIDLHIAARSKQGWKLPAGLEAVARCEAEYEVVLELPPARALR